MHRYEFLAKFKTWNGMERMTLATISWYSYRNAELHSAVGRAPDS